MEKQFVALLLLAGTLCVVPLAVLITHSHENSFTNIPQTHYYDRPIVSDCRQEREPVVQMVDIPAPQGFSSAGGGAGALSSSVSTIPSGGLVLPADQ